MHNIYESIKLLEKKFKRSIGLNISLSIILFTLTAVLVVLNLYAIRFNPGKEVEELKSQQVIFLIITAMSTLTSFVGGIMHLFVFKKKAKQQSDKIKKIKIEINKHELETGRYENKLTKDETLVTRVANILSEN